MQGDAVRLRLGSPVPRRPLPPIVALGVSENVPLRVESGATDALVDAGEYLEPLLRAERRFIR